MTQTPVIAITSDLPACWLSRLAITNHLATVFWLLSGMASRSIRRRSRRGNPVMLSLREGVADVAIQMVLKKCILVLLDCFTSFAMTTRVSRIMEVSIVEWLGVLSVKDETYLKGRYTRKGQAVRFPSLKRRPLRSGLSEHATQRTEGWLHGSRVPVGLLPAGGSGCAVDLS